MLAIKYRRKDIMKSIRFPGKIVAHLLTYLHTHLPCEINTPTVILRHADAKKGRAIAGRLPLSWDSRDLLQECAR